MTTHTGELAGRDYDRVFAALDGFRIEVPSWGFANTGTRFGKFVQGGAATSIEEKFADAGQVNALTGASPTVALHVLWDMPKGKGDVAEIRRLARQATLLPVCSNGTELQIKNLPRIFLDLYCFPV